MPCNSDGYDSPAYEVVNKLTRMLCWVMDKLDEKKITVGTNQELAEWWTHHKVLDAERKRYEAQEAQKAATRKAALAKLTPEERKALGV